MKMQISPKRIFIFYSENQDIGFVVNFTDIISIKIENFYLASIKNVSFEMQNSQGIVLENLHESAAQTLIQTHIDFTQNQAQQNQNCVVEKLIQEQQNDLNDKKNTQRKAFASIEDLKKNSQQLKILLIQLNTELKSLGDNKQEKSEFENIIKNLGHLPLLVKEEEGDSFQEKLTQQLYQICQQLFKIQGSIIPLIDLYYIYNEKRKIGEFLSSSDILISCQNFYKFGFQAQIVVYQGNIKVVEQIGSDEKLEFAQSFGKYLNYTEGLSSEQLSLKLKINMLLVRIKLQKYIKLGWVVIDDRVQGTKYFKNLILEIDEQQQQLAEKI